MSSRRPEAEAKSEPIARQTSVGEAPSELNPSPEGGESDDRPNTPCHVIRFGLVRACIWLNRTEGGPRHNVTVSRLYKGSDDRWYSTGSFGYRDLLSLAKCLDLAHTYVAEQIATSEVPF